jgi:hypothetical protein
MRRALAFVCLVASLARAGAGKPPAGITCDADSDCCWAPGPVVAAGARVPALLILSCVSARPVDLDTCRIIGDSLGWVLATCHATRNHRSSDSNDYDIVRTLRKLRRNPLVDTDRVFVFGFSGQGVQAMVAMFRHPQLLRGLVAVCPHAAAVPLADWPSLEGHLAYLVTRQQDWNRLDNEKMCQLFNENGLLTELVTTPGEHGPGPCTEILAGCRWLDRNSSPKKN